MAPRLDGILPVNEEQSYIVAAPFFTVVVPAHNRVHLLPRAIESVLAQSLADLELIVVDDGSTDSTHELVAAIGDPRVRYVFQQNAGAAAARNHGARLATGEYLTFLDSDDEALPGWLESLERGFVEHGADIVCCGLVKVGEGAEVKKKGGVTLPKDMGKMFGHVVGRFTNGGVFAMRRTVFEAVGGYVDGLRSGQHTELAMRLIPLAQERGWSIHNIMEPLIRVHVHRGHRIRGNPESIYLGSSYTLRAHPELFRRDPVLHGKYQAVAGVNAVRIGRVRESIIHFANAVRANPSDLEHWTRLALALVPPLARRRWTGNGTDEP
jgi:glycosyltransferase involved in cell wall biosynthesis